MAWHAISTKCHGAHFQNIKKIKKAKTTPIAETFVSSGCPEKQPFKYFALKLLSGIMSVKDYRREREGVPNDPLGCVRSQEEKRKKKKKKESIGPL